MANFDNNFDLKAVSNACPIQLGFWLMLSVAKKAIANEIMYGDEDRQNTMKEINNTLQIVANEKKAEKAAKKAKEAAAVEATMKAEAAKNQK